MSERDSMAGKCNKTRANKMSLKCAQKINIKRGKRSFLCRKEKVFLPQLDPEEL